MTSDYWKQLNTPDTVRLFCEMSDLRSHYANADEAVPMTEVWKDLASPDFKNADEFDTNIKFFSGDEEHKRKAGVIAFGRRITLVVSREFWELALRNDMLRNFLLAHEYAHVVLDHHASAAVIKNFKLGSRSGVNANIPPDWEEFETNVAAVFFQCGYALLNEEKTAFELAKKFYTDEYYVEKLQRLCQSKAFQNELNRRLARKSKPVVL